MQARWMTASQPATASDIGGITQIALHLASFGLSRMPSKYVAVDVEIEDGHAVARSEQLRNKVGADIAGAASDQNPFEEF